MRPVELVVCGALLATLTGCSYVSSTHPVGETPLKLEESEWEGSWIQTDGPITVRVEDADEGLIEIGWVEEKDGEFVLETLTAHLRTFEDWTFASFAGVEDTSGFLWSRLERDDAQAILWWPRAEAVANLVEAGLLPGKVEEGDVLLDRLETEHLAILVSEDRGVLFDWDEPMIFRRLP